MKTEVAEDIREWGQVRKEPEHLMVIILRVYVWMYLFFNIVIIKSKLFRIP